MTIEIFDIEQGSQEWHALRLGIPTASEFGAILAKGQGKVRRGYMMRLAAERLLGEPQEREVTAHMQRGKDLEEEARAFYGFLNQCEPRQVGFVRDSRGYGCSPDALIGEDGALEIKTRTPARMIEVLESGGAPAEYMAQIQGVLWICSRQWCDLFCYWPGMPVYIHRVHRDEAYIDALAAEVQRFNDELTAIVSRVWPAFEEDAA